MRAKPTDSDFLNWPTVPEKPRNPPRPNWWFTLPLGVAGFFVGLYVGPHLLVYVGPFVGMCGLYSMFRWIFRQMRLIGADHYEIVEKK